MREVFDVVPEREHDPRRLARLRVGHQAEIGSAGIELPQIGLEPYGFTRRGAAFRARARADKAHQGQQRERMGQSIAMATQGASVLSALSGGDRPPGDQTASLPECAAIRSES